MKTIAICADQACLSHPEMLGLGGENLEAQAWLATFSDAQCARDYLKNARDVEEVWVASSDQIEPINLAATLKKDCPSRSVLLVGDVANGSVQSRVAAAGLDKPISPDEFVRRYAQRKHLASFPATPNMFAGAAVGGVRGPLAAGGGGVAIEETGVMPGGLASRLVRTSAKGFLLPIVSGCGGSGKSTIAVLMALTAQNAGINTVLLDLDFQFGDCRELLSYGDALRFDQLVEAPSRVSQARRAADQVALVANPELMERAEPMLPRVPEVVALLQDAFDLVIVNTGSFWTDQHIGLLESCNKALFLLDQRPSALRGCRRAMDLCTRCGLAASPFVFAINRCTKSALYSSLDISCAFRGAQAVEFRDGGRDVGDLMAASQPLDLLKARNPLALSVADVLGEIVPVAREAGIGRGSGNERSGLFTSFLRK